MRGIPPQIFELLLAGESETLGFKTSIGDPALLARLIASFANAEGGTILVGVTEPPEVIGIDEGKMWKVYQAALRLLEHSGIRT